MRDAPQVPQFGDGIYSGEPHGGGSTGGAADSGRGGESAQGTCEREDGDQELELEKGVEQEVVEDVLMEERGGLSTEALEQPPVDPRQYPVDDSLVS